MGVKPLRTSSVICSFALGLAAVICLLVLLTGCATVADFDRGAEVAFQTAHLVDTVQTYRGAASDPCYAEGDPVTRRLIGREPSRAGVVAWGIGYGAIHYGVTRLLVDHGHERIAAVWELVTIEATGRAIADNVRVGIRIGAPNVHPACIFGRRGDVYVSRPAVMR
jgi:hypothetical protein